MTFRAQRPLAVSLTHLFLRLGMRPDATSFASTKAEGQSCGSRSAQIVAPGARARAYLDPVGDVLV
eukprot:767989-Hanusia_phi.AAC.7